MQANRHPIFRTLWWTINLLFCTAIISTLYRSVREYSVGRYLDGFSDAIVPNSLPAERKLEAILAWMRSGSYRVEGAEPDGPSQRDPVITLNYAQLLAVCGTATDGFLNLARSSEMRVRRLLLLDANHNAKHVVAEVLLDRRWVVVDLAYGMVMRDAGGRMLTRTDLLHPELFAQPTSVVPNYPGPYTYERFAPVRLERLPIVGVGLRRGLDWALPGWEEMVDWSLLVERESFFMLFVSIGAALFLVLARTALAWRADCWLRVPRFQLRKLFQRAGAALFSAPEIH